MARGVTAKAKIWEAWRFSNIPPHLAVRCGSKRDLDLRSEKRPRQCLAGEGIRGLPVRGRRVNVRRLIEARRELTEPFSAPATPAAWRSWRAIIGLGAAVTEPRQLCGVACVMDELKWLPAPKLCKYYVEPAVGDAQEAQRVLYLAVITGQVRARSKGRVLRLNQIASMEEINPFGLPSDIELSIEDARQKWGVP